MVFGIFFVFGWTIDLIFYFWFRVHADGERSETKRQLGSRL